MLSSEAPYTAFKIFHLIYKMPPHPCTYESFFKDFVAMTPSLAYYLGDKRRDDHCENSLGDEYKNAYRALIKRYHKNAAAPGRSRRSTTQATSCSIQNAVLTWKLDIEIEGDKYPLDLMPTTSFENIVLDLHFAEEEIYKHSTPEATRSRRADYIQILESATDLMRKGIAAGITIPRRICKQMLRSMSDDHAVIPGLETAVSKMKTFVRDEYLPACRKTLGYCHMGKVGKRMYKYLVKEQTTLDISPEEVHAYGLEEVARIERGFIDLKSRMGFTKTKSLYSFYRQVMNDETHYIKTGLMNAYDQVRKRVEATWRDHFDYKLHRNYALKEVSKEMQDTAAAAFYMPSTKSYRGTFFVNTGDVHGNPKYSMYALSLHEGFHHYQYEYMVEKRVPTHMIYGIDGTAYVEGIAHYAEALGDYSHSPEEIFGKLSYEMLRAVRLVVDTGIHWYGWSWKKALVYMRKHLPISMTEIKEELERYVCIPGQALCYRLGRRVCIELRNKYLAVHGQGAEKAFHELILEDGVLPLEVLKKKIEKSI